MTTFTGLKPPVFVDSAGWVALQNPRDRDHESCVQVLRTFADRALVTNDLVLSETYTRLRFDVSFAAAESARNHIEDIRRSGRLRVVFIDHLAFEQAWTMFERFPRMKGLSFVDASIGALAQTESFREVLSLDRHLSAFGLSVRPG